MKYNPLLLLYYFANQFLQNIKKYWRLDVLAGFSVSLVALPLSIGIAIAMNLPIYALMAGIISAMIGGIITTFLRSGNVTINGPSPALIGIVIGAMSLFGSWPIVLAAIVCSGVLQLIFGVFRLGILANFLPSSVVQGMMAAIGVIILSGQVHTGLGVSFSGATDLDNLLAIPQSLFKMNPFIAIIFFNSLVILAWHPHTKSKFFKYVPAPIWILLFSIPLYAFFQYISGGQDISLFGNVYSLNPANDLVNLPDSILDGFSIRPDFSQAGTLSFWLLVISIFLISTIETLGSAKAIDKIDPLRRKTEMNRDVAAMGLSTIIAGFLGGLPVISVIARSSVNVNHGAHTKLSNFVHGSLILLFVFLLSPYIQMVPKAALMAILVYSGYKLASPKVFKDATLKGYEQFLILLVTLYVTLVTDLNRGILVGILFTVVVHLIRSHLPPSKFFGYLINSNFQLAEIQDHYHLRIKGIANFTSIVKLKRILAEVPAGQRLVVDFSDSRLVDFSFLESINEWEQDYTDQDDGTVEIVGLDEHLTTSEHPFGIHSLPQKVHKPLSKRQKGLKELCAEKQWSFTPDVNWNIGKLRKNTFFVTRPIEYSKNKISGKYTHGSTWIINDITFSEGALMAAEVHNGTMLRIHLDFEVPNFEIDKERFFDRLLDFATKEEIQLQMDEDLEHKFVIKGQNKEQIKHLFNRRLQNFISKNNEYHIESFGSTLLVFRYFRFMTNEEIQTLVSFGDELVQEFRNASMLIVV